MNNGIQQASFHAWSCPLLSYFFRYLASSSRSIPIESEIPHYPRDSSIFMRRWWDDERRKFMRFFNCQDGCTTTLRWYVNWHRAGIIIYRGTRGFSDLLGGFNGPWKTAILIPWPIVLNRRFIKATCLRFILFWYRERIFFINNVWEIYRKYMHC